MEDTKKVVFLDRGTIPRSVTFSDLGGKIKWIEHEKTVTEAEIVDRLVEADICVTNKVEIRASALQKIPGLKMIALTATGSNNIDLEYCKDHGIVVCNSVAYGTPSISEHVFMMILAIQRNLLRYREAAFQRWKDGPFFAWLEHPVGELHGKVLGIVGRGTLGEAVGRLGEAFGMRVLYGERRHATELRPGYTEFAELLRTADVLSLHAPLTAETENLIGTEEFAAMKRESILINTARGGIVNESALVNALRNGEIAGAGIDVTRPEPPEASNLLLTLEDLPNVILTPHMAWSGKEALRQVSLQVGENIDAFLKGQPIRQLV